MLKHLGIIMDGNGRWAKRQQTSKLAGYTQGAETAKNIVLHCTTLGIEQVTLYAFSLENWQRPDQEVADLINLFSYYLRNEVELLNKNNICLNIIGDRSKFAEDMRDNIDYIENLTQNNTGLKLCLALSYGGRDEILRAITKLVKEGKELPVTEQEFRSYLDQPAMQDVDLVIRTSGEMRISNFLIWQMAYSELYFCDKLWPDFTNEDLDKAIDSFHKRKRNFGHAREQN